MDKFSLFFENDSRSFLRTIFKNPFEAAGKLVFADWLDEEGKTMEAKLMRLAAQYQQNGDEWSSQDIGNEFGYSIHILESDLARKNIQIVSNRVKYFKAFDYYQLTSNGVEHYTPDEGLVPIDLNEIPEDILEGIVYQVVRSTAPYASSEHIKSFEHGLNSLGFGMDKVSISGIREIYSGIRLMFSAMRHDENVAKKSNWRSWGNFKNKIRLYIENLNSYSNKEFVVDAIKKGINVKDLIIDLKVLLKELPDS